MFINHVVITYRIRGPFSLSQSHAGKDIGREWTFTLCDRWSRGDVITTTCHPVSGDMCHPETAPYQKCWNWVSHVLRTATSLMMSMATSSIRTNHIAPRGPQEERENGPPDPVFAWVLFVKWSRPSLLILHNITESHPAKFWSGSPSVLPIAIMQDCKMRDCSSLICRTATRRRQKEVTKAWFFYEIPLLTILGLPPDVTLYRKIGASPVF